MQLRHPLSTIPELVAKAIREHGERPVIHAANRPALTYKELGRQIDATADALARAGFGRRNRVGVALPHGPEFPVAIAAVCCAAVCAPLNDRLTEDALADLLAAERVEALLVAEGAETNAARAARQLAIPVFELHVGPNAPAGVFELIAPGTSVTVALQPAQPSDLALVTHTSGTTGVPKVIRFEHWRLAEAVRNQVEATSIGPADRCLYVTPFFSMAAIRHGLLRALTAGGSLVCPTGLDVEVLVDLLEATQATILLAPPAVQLAMLEEYERRERRPQHALRFIQSSFTELTAQTQQRLETVFGVPVIAGYGMSEVGIIAQSPWPPESAPPGSVGRPCFVDVAIADEAGLLLPAGARGEIIVRGPQVFEGYENDDKANRLAFRDGWFRTGDAGSVDRDGFLFLAGRIGDVINRGGNKIAPGEIEAALLVHPQVAEAAAFALPHETLGQDAAAAVVLRDSRTSETDLRRFLRSRLAAFKLPSCIIAVPQLPRGALGKIDRRELARLVQRGRAADLEPPRGRTEIELARIFADALELPTVTRCASFFHLGGDSLRGVRALAAVESLFGVALTLETLFDHPTVAGLAAEVDHAAADGSTAGEAAADKVRCEPNGAETGAKGTT